MGCLDTHIPASITSYLVQPEIVWHFLEDYIMSPLLIINVAYLTGREPSRMLPCMIFSTISTTCYIGAVVAPTDVHRFMLLGSGLCFLGMAGQEMNQLPAQAATISTRNKLRTQMAGDLLVF